MRDGAKQSPADGVRTWKTYTSKVSTSVLLSSFVFHREGIASSSVPTDVGTTPRKLVADRVCEAEGSACAMGAKQSPADGVRTWKTYTSKVSASVLLSKFCIS
jgi:hypothetical protein